MAGKGEVGDAVVVDVERRIFIHKELFRGEDDFRLRWLCQCQHPHSGSACGGGIGEQVSL
jgi:hypothetical protein